MRKNSLAKFSRAKRSELVVSFEFWIELASGMEVGIEDSMVWIGGKVMGVAGGRTTVDAEAGADRKTSGYIF